MRVTLVSAHGADPAFGGAERYVGDLGHGLSRRGHEVDVLSAFPPRADAGLPTRVLHRTDWREDELRRIRNHAGDVLSPPWPAVERAIAELRPDLIHTNNLPGIGTGVWEVARRAGVPVVHTLHDYYLLCPRTTLRRRDGQACDPHPLLCGLRTRRLARWSGSVAALIAGSRQLLARHERIFGVSRGRVIRLPLTALPGPAREAPRSLRRIGYLGALTETKGVRVLVEAAPALAELGVELCIAGEGPLREVVERAPVRYLGRVSGQAKLDMLRDCDAGIVPSLWDEPSGPPYVVLEWLAARRPVLVSGRGGLAESAAGGGVAEIGASAPDIVAAVAGLTAAPAWDELAAAVPEVAGDSDLERWLDESEAVYAEVAGRR